MDVVALARQLPADVERYIARFVARRRTQRLLRAAARAVLFTIVWTLAWCVIDRLFPLHAASRTTALVINAAVVAAVVARPLLVLLRPADEVAAAAEIERREPRWSQRLRTITSSLADAGDGSSTELLDALSRQVADEVHGTDPAKLLPWRPVLRPAAACATWLAFAWLMSASTWLDLPTLARRYFLPLGGIPAVTTTRLAVHPGHAEVTQGDPLRVQASASRLGDAPPPTLHVRPSSDAATPQAWHVEPMTAMPDGTFVAEIARVDRDLEYFITGGDARTRTFSVTMLPRPAVKQFHIRYAYPPHTGLPPREVRGTSGAVEAPAGTEVTLDIETTQPLSYLIMTSGAESNRIPPSPGQPTSARASFTVQADQRYTLRMVSGRGVSGVFRGGTIRAIADRAPVAQFRGDLATETTPGQVGGGDVLPVAYQAVDDYGLARLDVEVRVVRRSGAEANASLPVPLTTAGRREQQGVLPVDLRRFALGAGDEVELRLQAEDRAGQFALSPPVRVAVTSPAAPSTRPAQAAPPAVATDAAPPPVASPPFEPSGYGDAIRAYFDALRRGGPPTRP